MSVVVVERGWLGQDVVIKSGSGEKQQARVMYVGHIPHGFFEKEMRDFFEQFGTITRLRISRSKKVRGGPLVLAVSASIVVNWSVWPNI